MPWNSLRPTYSVQDLTTRITGRLQLFFPPEHTLDAEALPKNARDV